MWEIDVVLLSFLFSTFFLIIIIIFSYQHPLFQIYDCISVHCVHLLWDGIIVEANGNSNFLKLNKCTVVQLLSILFYFLLSNIKLWTHLNTTKMAVLFRSTVTWTIINIIIIVIIMQWHHSGWVGFLFLFFVYLVKLFFFCSIHLSSSPLFWQQNDRFIIMFCGNL